MRATFHARKSSNSLTRCCRLRPRRSRRQINIARNFPRFASARHPVQLRAGVLCAADALIAKLGDNLESSLLCKLAKVSQLHFHRLAVVRCADSRVDCHFHFAPPFGFGPGFCAAFTLRPFAMSASVQSQRVRPSNGIPRGRIFPSLSQRCSVMNETPILFAACGVLNVLFFLIL